MNRYPLALFASVMFATAATAAPPSLAPAIQLPPLTQPAGTESHPGKVVWADLVTPNLQQSEQFYAGLFGWSFQPVPGDRNFAIALANGRPVGGLVQRPMPSDHLHHPAWLTFLAVPDVGAAERAAMANGGKVLSPTKNYPQRGRQAVLSDPDGAVFAVLSSSSGDPPDERADPGEWIWSSLLAPRPDQEAAFYRTLFGYEVVDLPRDDSARHLILSSDEYARAGIHALPADSTHHAHWLNFVRVDDAAVAASKAVELGGRVLVQPHIDRHGGAVAVIADPTGAPVGLMEWTNSDEPGEAP
jgi:hypothetical protein